MSGYKDRELYRVRIDLLEPNPEQPRKYIDSEALGELAASVKKHGVLQPIIFRLVGEKHVIVSGERRYRAAREAGLAEIPAVYLAGEDSAEVAIVENLLREDLNPIEEAEALQKLKDEKNYSHEQLSQVIGKAISTLSEILSLNKLPPKIREKCRNNPNVTRRALVEIAKAPDRPAMTKLFKKYEKQNLSSEVLREKTRKPRGLGKRLAIMIDSLNKELKRLDYSQLTDEEKPEIEKKLSDLKNTLADKSKKTKPKEEKPVKATLDFGF